MKNTSNSNQKTASLGILTKYASTPDFKGLAELAVRRTAKYSLQEESKNYSPQNVSVSAYVIVSMPQKALRLNTIKKENRRITATCNAAVVYGLVLYARHRLVKAEGKS